MANRYWVGGTGTWDATSTTNWSDVSGGVGGASAPTSVDDVYFDSLSNATAYTATVDSTFIGTASVSGSTLLTVTAVTKGTLAVGQTVYRSTGLNAVYRPFTIISLGTGTGGVGTYTVSGTLSFTSSTIRSGFPQFNNLNIQGPTLGNVTVAGSSPLFCYGSIILPSTGFTSTFGGDINYLSSNQNNTITYNGNIFGIAVFGGTGGWVLGSAFTPIQSNAQSIFIYNGTFDTAGYSITAGSIIIAGSNAKKIYLRSSTITITQSYQPLYVDNTNTTFDAGTSNIIFGGNTYYQPCFGGTGGVTYYNITLNTAVCQFATQNTFNNITLLPRSALTLSANITINGTLSSNNTTPYRNSILSSDLLTQRTIICSNFNISNTNFRYINMSNNCSGTNLGDVGGNSNITFPAAKTVYWNNTVGGSWTGNFWALVDGGNVNYDNFPLPQDTVKFTNTGVGSGSTISIVSENSQAQGTVDFSQVTVPFTYLFAKDYSATSFIGWPRMILGDFLLSSSMTLTSDVSSASFNFRGVNKIQTFNTAGKTLAQSVSFWGVNSTLNIIGNLTTPGTFSVGTGILNTNNNAITTAAFASSNTLSRSLNLGTSTVTLTGTGTVWDTSTATNLTLDAANSTIVLQNAGDQTFAGGGLTYGKLKVKSP